MIQRLHQALQHIDELPPQAQEEIAQRIEEWTGKPSDWRSLIGSVLLPEDFDEVDAILRARHETAPSPPIEDEL